VVSLVSRYKNDTIRSHIYGKKISTRSRGKLKIKIGFVILRLAKYINNTTSISLVEMGLKKDFVHVREQSNSDLCVFIFLNPVFYFVGS
jgi:hypothetical protein